MKKYWGENYSVGGKWVKSKKKKKKEILHKLTCSCSGCEGKVEGWENNSADNGMGGAGGEKKCRGVKNLLNTVS